MEPERSGTVAKSDLEAGTAGLQVQALLTFAAIFAHSGMCHRKVALCVGASHASCAATLAVSALGGACLVLENDVAKLQAAGRLGATDFTVTSLPEALRILKNEVRQGTPVSVGVAGEPKMLIGEMLRRGVQPDLVFGDADHDVMLGPFVDLGAVAPPATLPLELRCARLAIDVAENLAERRQRDSGLAKVLAENELEVPQPVRTVNARWLAVAPRLFPRDRQRVYLEWRTEE